ncbi:MAG: dihydropteroate synthase [Crocinitomicaceae bacterium]|nr:dihydropteroate synthase [Crocinitomicaceae bacterium]
MGILNVTSDSFYYQGSILTVEEALKRAGQMLDDGADIIDIGGQSTRPGATRIPPEKERDRVLPVVEAIFRHFPEAIISIDTFYASVAKVAVYAGAAIVNDVSAGRIDPALIPTVAGLHVPYILMHMLGEPQNMQDAPVYKEVVSDIILFLSERLSVLRAAGIHDVIIDPGFGFGKTRAHNYELLRRLKELDVLGCPVLAGLSRKKMIRRSMCVATPEEALTGTIAANMLALTAGAHLLRVHDVKEAVQTIRIYQDWIGME